MVKKVTDDLILQYEKDFFSFNFCSNRAKLENRLASDFVEYGSSGVIYDRESTINALVGLTRDRPIEIHNFKLSVLSKDILLAHYITHHKDDGKYALRTSIWKFENSNWKMYFHQGTPLQSNRQFITKQP